MFGKIKDGNLITLGPVVKVGGSWIDSDGDEAAQYRADNGFFPVEDNPASCPCTDGCVPKRVGFAYDNPQNPTKIVIQYAACSIADADAKTLAKACCGINVSTMKDKEKSTVIQKLANFVAKSATLLAFCLFAFSVSAEVMTAPKGELTDADLVVTNVTEGASMTTNAVRDIIQQEIPHERGVVVFSQYADSASSAGNLIDSESAPWTKKVDRRVSSASVTNAGAVAEAKDYADGKFLPATKISDDDPKMYRIDDADIINFNGTHTIRSGRISLEGSFENLIEHEGEPNSQSLPDFVRGVVLPVSNTVSNWENYWRGDRVRLSITNYYGNTSGEPPRLRIEEFDHAVTNADHTVSNVYRVVWDEVTRQTNYQERIEAKVDALSNGVMTAAWKQTNLQLTDKAPRAWQTVTSAGEDAPPNTVWHTAPSTVFAGGTEYAHVAVGEGTICVLVDKGAPVFTEGAEGQFRFTDESGENFFGFDVRSAYTIGCRTDGISVDNSARLVSLTYDLTSASPPTVMHCDDLNANVWEEQQVTWEQNPPAGTMICYIDIGDSPSGFYKAQIEYAGGAKFITNMQADLAGGIAATNETLDVIQSVEPYIQNGQVLWRIKQ